MGVDVRRGAGLGVAELVGHDHQRGAVGNHQAGVGVPEGRETFINVYCGQYGGN